MNILVCELYKNPEESLPKEGQFVIFFPKGCTCPVSGVFQEGNFYQGRFVTRRRGKTSYHMELVDEVMAWAPVPHFRIEDDTPPET